MRETVPGRNDWPTTHKRGGPKTAPLTRVRRGRPRGAAAPGGWQAAPAKGGPPPLAGLACQPVNCGRTTRGAQRRIVVRSVRLRGRASLAKLTRAWTRATAERSGMFAVKRR